MALPGTSNHVKEFDVGENLDQSSRVQAVCDYCNPTDLLQMHEHALPTAFLNHDAANSPEAMLIGGPIQELKDAANKANRNSKGYLPCSCASTRTAMAS